MWRSAPTEGGGGYPATGSMACAGSGRLCETLHPDGKAMDGGVAFSGDVALSSDIVGSARASGISNART